jgi:hypothetical protein
MNAGATNPEDYVSLYRAHRDPESYVAASTPLNWLF